jgi:hypothetical protein
MTTTAQSHCASARPIGFRQPHRVADEFLRVGLAQTLGIESVAILAALDSLATILDGARVFDGLTTSGDALRVAGALAWLAVLSAPAPGHDVPSEVAVRGVRAKVGFDGVDWDERQAVSRAFFAAADVL